MGGGHKWLVVGLRERGREREREREIVKRRGIKKKFLFLAFALGKML